MRKILSICALVMTLTTAYSQDQYIELEKVNDSARVMQTIEEIDKKRKEIYNPDTMLTRFAEYFKKHQMERRFKKIESKIKIRTEIFIEKARKIHGDKYDYSKAKYFDAETKICIICPKHGEFLQTPDTHLKKKRGCLQCGLKRCNKGRKNGQKKH